ncbi:hypothetical protein TGDOM2_401930, partial [Toxoplasma gondii GAB2-2007-GAL-DOM2]
GGLALGKGGLALGEVGLALGKGGLALGKGGLVSPQEGLGVGEVAVLLDSREARPRLCKEVLGLVEVVRGLGLGEGEGEPGAKHLGPSKGQGEDAGVQVAG